MALQLLPRTAAARAHSYPIGIVRPASVYPSTSPTPAAGDFGLRPQDLHGAYSLPLDSESSTTQTVAVVDAYNDPNAASDLESYDTEFGLPKCTVASGCFEQVNQRGESGNLPFPQNAGSMSAEEASCEAGDEQACFAVEEAAGWSVEISLDIETVRAVCQNCHIALVEADEPSLEDLERAEEAAAGLGAQELSNSWGSPECIEDVRTECVHESSSFNHPGLVITAAAGDDGYLGWLEEPRSGFASFPASLPQVIAVGGSSLDPLSGGKWTGEAVWNDGGKAAGRPDGYGAGGGGCSVQFTAQAWQQHVSDWSSVGCGGKRAVADVAADADPHSGVAVYDTSPECASEYREGGSWHLLENWCTIGGTSLASPLVASVFALAGGAHGVRYPAQTLYQNAVKSPASLHDITVGSNAECDAPFNTSTFTTGCTQEAEAKAGCADTLICQAGAGYDGPTGVGTPDGISAFELPAGGLSEEATEGGGDSGSGASGPITSGASAPVKPSATPPSSGASADIQVQLSGFALTLKALVALNASHPKIPNVSFRFTANIAGRVRVTFAERVGKRGHQHWKTLTRPLTIAAVSGRNNGRLSGHGVLGSGSYRLTLSPVDGAASSIVFKIG
jgi:Subtilase family